MTQVVPATLEHALELAVSLRKDDHAEIKASSGWSPEDALVLSVAASGKALTWLEDGKVVAMFGVAPTGRAGVGCPWMIGTEAVSTMKMKFLRRCRAYIAQMLEQYPVLVNYVDCRNTISIQWLSWCGFALCEVEPFHGVQRLPFIRFQMAR